MAIHPLVMALPIRPRKIYAGLARKARPDAISAPGVPTLPNQVNNVRLLPFILRGALDVGDTVHQRKINSSVDGDRACLSARSAVGPVPRVWIARDARLRSGFA